MKQPLGKPATDPSNGASCYGIGGRKPRTPMERASRISPGFPESVPALNCAYLREGESGRPSN